jgi:hypothetical protein
LEERQTIADKCFWEKVGCNQLGLIYHWDIEGASVGSAGNLTFKERAAGIKAEKLVRI